MRLREWLLAYSFKREVTDNNGVTTMHDSYTESQWQDAFEIFKIELAKFKANSNE